MRLIIFLLIINLKLYSQSTKLSRDTLYVIYPKTELIIHHPSNPTKTNFDKIHYSLVKPEITYFSIKGFDIYISDEITDDIKIPILKFYPNDLYTEKKIIINKNTILIRYESDGSFEVINKK